MDAQPRLAATAALTALVQALARLELEEGYAPAALVNAQEALAENRFIAARDSTTAELIDPARCVRVPVAHLLDDLLAAVHPHAEALDSLEELAEVRMLVLSPEIARQERLMASAGPRVLTADLAARFSD